MFLELIATFVAGIGAAGIVLLINKLSGGRLPRWVMPVAAGLTMLGFTVWSEYTWAARTMAELPPGMDVIDEVPTRAVWKPWTYVVPQITRLAAVDVANMQTNSKAPSVRLVTLYLFARWRPPAVVPQLVDCAEAARADVTDAALADPSVADWIAVGRDARLIDRACTGNAEG